MRCLQNQVLTCKVQTGYFVRYVWVPLWWGLLFWDVCRGCWSFYCFHVICYSALLCIPHTAWRRSKPHRSWFDHLELRYVTVLIRIIQIRTVPPLDRSDLLFGRYRPPIVQTIRIQIPLLFKIKVPQLWLDYDHFFHLLVNEFFCRLRVDRSKQSPAHFLFFGQDKSLYFLIIAREQGSCRTVNTRTHDKCDSGNQQYNRATRQVLWLFTLLGKNHYFSRWQHYVRRSEGFL